MSGVGNCYDNAPMESFFSLLKTELVHHERYETRQAAKTSIFDYIEVFYNRQRIDALLAICHRLTMRIVDDTALP